MTDSAPQNNFDLLRLLAAISVIISHAYLLDGQVDPYSRVTGTSLGFSAVVMFFAISGFLIAQSLERRTLPAFAIARGLRIFPGLAVCVLVTAVALAPVSNLPVWQYLSNTQTFRFIFGNATLLSTEYSLPGVFSDYRSNQTNGSLWTLRYEVASYFLITVLAIATMSRPALRNLAVAIVLIASFAMPALTWFTARSIPIQILNMTDLFMPFIVGSWLFWSGRKVAITHVAASITASLLLSHTPFYGPATTLAVALLILWIAVIPFGGLTSYRKWPDYSYGIYIYAYPIQQVISHALPAVHPLAKAMIATLVVLIPASLSWHFVERPFLSLKTIWQRETVRPDKKPLVLEAPARPR